MRRLLALVLALPLLGGGCVTVIAATQGRPLNPEAVSGLQAGATTLTEVLAALGAPHEVHNHADGRLLVYRHKARNTFRLGISAGQATRFLDASQVVAELIDNLSLTIQRVHYGEDRVVLLLDREDVVQAVGFQANTADVPVF